MTVAVGVIILLSIALFLAVGGLVNEWRQNNDWSGLLESWNEDLTSYELELDRCYEVIDTLTSEQGVKEVEDV